MRVTAITPNAFQLTQLGFVNLYLVREPDSFTLIDTGISKSVDPILKAARQHGSPIKRILLTHAHMDHIAGLDSLAHLLGSVDVAISRRDGRLLASPPDMSFEAGEPQTKLRGGYPGARTRPTHFVADSELFCSLRVIATPGHTPGHMSFFDERDGTLYAGDAFVGVGRLRVVCDAPWYFPNLFTWNNSLSLASAKRLVDLPVQRVACGHGAVREGHHLFTAALDHAQ